MTTRTLLDIWEHAGLKCAITKISNVDIPDEPVFCAYVQSKFPATGIAKYEIETDMPWFAKIMVPQVPWLGISDATWTEKQAREAAEGLAAALGKI